MDFIKSLGEDATDFKFVLWDRPKLDQLCLKHQGIVNAPARDEDYIKEEINALNVERAVLAKTEDLMEGTAARVGDI